MAKPMNIQQFFQQFPTDDACLEHLFRTRYGANPKCPKCGERGLFRKLSKMPAYTCNCGHHIHPMAGTPFERSRTPLQKWFYVMYLFTTTRNGFAAKEIQRQLGVTYKTAWRMGHKIREYMAFVDGDAPLGGSGTGNRPVEADKAFIGGKDKAGHDDKHVVLGMVERGGDVVLRSIANRRWEQVMPQILTHVAPGARMMTDEAHVFKMLTEQGYEHKWVTHRAKEYVRGNVHTNTIEGMWSWLKRGIYGTHVSVSRKHLPKYLGEFEFRFNLRKQAHLMFPILLQAFPRP